jgi:hypothetical protein
MQHHVRLSPRLQQQQRKSVRGRVWIALLWIAPLLAAVIWGSMRLHNNT